MEREFTIEIFADNNFLIFNRIIYILNRRRIRIKKIMAKECEDDFNKSETTLLLYTTAAMIEKVKHQLEKLIEVESVLYSEGCNLRVEQTKSIEVQIPTLYL